MKRRRVTGAAGPDIDGAGLKALAGILNSNKFE